MKKSYRILSLLFAVLMLFSAIAATPAMVYAAENEVISTEVSQDSNGLVTIKVNIPNGTKVTSGRVVVKFDSSLLTLKNVSKDQNFDVDDLVQGEDSVDYAFANADEVNLTGSVLTLTLQGAKVPRVETTITTEIVELYDGSEHITGAESVLEDTIKVGEAPFLAPTITSARSSVYLLFFRRATITWTPVEGAVGYELYRSTTRYGTYYRVANTSATSYTDPLLSRLTNYYYVVRAYKYVDGKIVRTELSPVVLLR